MFSLPALPSEHFNRLSAQEKLPFRIEGEIEPENLLFDDASMKEMYVQNGSFTEAFETAYRGLVELKRQESVAQSLGECRIVEMLRDFSGCSPAEQQMVRHLGEVCKKIDLLYMKQKGSFDYIATIEARKEQDPQSHKLFWRNQGPWAVTPKALNDPFANALPNFPEQQVGVYPADLTLDEDYAKLKEAQKEFSQPWTALIRDGAGALKTVRFFEHFATEMQEIAKELDLAAHAIRELEQESALKEYLEAAANAFRNGDWDAADRKWVAMNMSNSNYALRVAPDETYWDPQNDKAGFEFWFAQVDRDAAEFSKVIKPHIQAMEEVFHDLYTHYPSREISFELPDFIDMALLGGDARMGTGAILGQALPNFSDDLSRMVVMTNYGTDPASLDEAKQKAKVMLVEDQLAFYQPCKLISTTNTLLHEMTHCMGVQCSNFVAKNADGSDRADGTTSRQALGGANAQVMEELKAQTGGLYWIGWLQEKGLVTDEMAKKLYTDAIMWAYGHISTGMWEKDRSPKAYSQLAGIQIRHFIDTGAMTKEDGKYRIHYDKMHASVRELFTKVHSIQVHGDANAAEAWRLDVADGEGKEVIELDRIRELYAQFPRLCYQLEIKV